MDDLKFDCFVVTIKNSEQTLANSHQKLESNIYLKINRNEQMKLSNLKQQLKLTA